MDAAGRFRYLRSAAGVYLNSRPSVRISRAFRDFDSVLISALARKGRAVKNAE